MDKKVFCAVFLFLVGCCHAAGEGDVDLALKRRAAVPDLMRLSVPSQNRALRFIDDRDRIHESLKNFYEQALKDYLLRYQEQVKKIPRKRIKKIVKEFREDALSRRKRQVYLFSWLFRTNYRNWYDEYRRRLIYAGKDVDKSRGKRQRRYAKKFEKLLWKAEHKFARLYKETKDAYIYALKRAIAKIGVVQKVKPEKTEEIPAPPPVPEFKTPRKKRAYERKLEREMARRKREMRGGDVDEGRGEVFDIERSEQELEVEPVTRGEMEQRAQPEELLKEIRRFKKERLKKAEERELAPKKEEKPDMLKRLHQDIEKQRSKIEEMTDEDDDDNEEW